MKTTRSSVLAMNGRRETCLQLSLREVFNVGFLSSGGTRACWNAVGKMPVRRDVLMMCVSAGKSVGEIAWRRCEGIGSRGHVVGWLERRSLDTEGEDGSLSSGSSWLGVLCEWRLKLTTDCFSFVCKKSCKVISCYRRGGRW